MVTRSGASEPAKRKAAESPKTNAVSRGGLEAGKEGDEGGGGRSKRAKTREWTESDVCQHLQGGGAPGDLGVLQLRLFLRNKGLGQAGNKEELVQRIQQHVSDHLKESKEAQNKVEPSATPVKLGQLSDADAFKQLEGGSGDPKDLNVRQLKAFLRVKGLKESGNKTELVERVRQFLKGGNEDGAEGDDEEEEDEGEEDEEEEGEEEGDDDEEGEEDEEGEGEEQEQEQVQAEVAVVKTKPPKSRVNTKDFDDDQVHQYVQGGGAPEDLSLPQIKSYIKEEGLRVTGNKQELIDRIKEYIKLSTRGAQNVYPESSFTKDVRATRDVVKGDTVLFTQTIYDGYDWQADGAFNQPIGERIVAAHVTKEGFGGDSKQQTFTLEVLWTKGKKPLDMMSSLIIKGKNMFHSKILRRPWADESKRRPLQADLKKRESDAKAELQLQASKPTCAEKGCKYKKAPDCTFNRCGRCCKKARCKKHGYLPAEGQLEYDSDDYKYGGFGGWY